MIHKLLICGLCGSPAVDHEVYKINLGGVLVIVGNLCPDESCSGALRLPEDGEV